jgi:branched-chain amino acid transport system substrate-binding protein
VIKKKMILQTVLVKALMLLLLTPCVVMVGFVITIGATSDLAVIDDIVKTGYGKYIEWEETEGINDAVVMLVDWLERRPEVVNVSQYGTYVSIEFEGGYPLTMMLGECYYKGKPIENRSGYQSVGEYHRNDAYSLDDPQTPGKAAVLDVIKHEGWPPSSWDIQDSLAIAGYNITFRASYPEGVTLNWLTTLDENEFTVVYLRTHGGVAEGKLYLMAGDGFETYPEPSGFVGTTVFFSPYGGEFSYYHYAFNDEFIRTYVSDMSFPNTIWYNLACYSACQDAEDDMIDAFLDNGGYVWIGWTKPCSVMCGEPATVLFFRRMATGDTVGEAITEIEVAGYSPDNATGYDGEPLPSFGSILRAVPLAHSDATLYNNSKLSVDYEKKEIMISGQSAGSGKIDIAILGPEGFTEAPLSFENGFMIYNFSVNPFDYWMAVIEIPEEVKEGDYLAAILSPGRDYLYGSYGEGAFKDYLLSEYDLESLAGKTQEMLLAILTELIDRPGGDDLVVGVLQFYLEHMTPFDTGEGMYPSISGTHNGTITPICDTNVSTLYTYPCPGTGGHTEYVKIWNNTDWNVTATWNGYVEDWHNITFNQPFILRENETYNYTIVTGSYPQIIHAQSKEVTGGTITCTKFVDANGKEHYDWIPAIRLEGDVMRIGIVAPLTGDASTAGNDMWQAAVLAADEINAQGGVSVNGVNMKITLVKGDTETSNEGGVNAVTKLITEDKVDLLVGGFSSTVTLADQVVAAEHKVPFIITGASHPGVTRRTDINTSYFFHHCPTTDDFPNATLLFVEEIVKPQIYENSTFPAERPLRLAVLYQDSNYGEGVSDGIDKTIEHYNLSMVVVATEKFNIGETDYTSVLATIKEEEPDVVYPAAFVTEQPLIVAQGRRNVSLNTTYLSVECNDDPGYYTGVERWGEYSIQESRFSPYATPGPINSAVVEFKGDYENRWGTSPGMMGASTYEGVYIAAEAIEHAGTIDKEEIREALTEIEMPQMIELMKDDVITFSQDYRESKFELYMQQLIWNETAGETRPKIVWPDNIKETDFVLPDWYEPGSP